MTPIVETICARWGVSAELIKKDREMYASQIQTMRDNLNAQYSKEIMELSQWMMNETTAGQGSVMAATTGDYDRYRNPRKK